MVSEVLPIRTGTVPVGFQTDSIAYQRNHASTVPEEGRGLLLTSCRKVAREHFVKASRNRFMGGFRNDFTAMRSEFIAFSERASGLCS